MKLFSIYHVRSMSQCITICIEYIDGGKVYYLPLLYQLQLQLQLRKFGKRVEVCTKKSRSIVTPKKYLHIN